MSLASLTEPALIFPQLPGLDRDEVLKELARRIAGHGPELDAEGLYRLLREREELGSTGIGAGVAVPHCKMKGLDRVVLAVAVCEEAIDFGAEDGQPVRLLFGLISPDDQPAAHLKSLAEISRWVKTESAVEKILDRSEPDAIYELLLQEETAA